MNVPRIRQGLHHLYTLLTLALIATGLLIGHPEWRAQLLAAWRKTVTRTREILGLESPAPLPFDREDELKRDEP